MAVMMPRERWTDERLDDLNEKVDDGFAHVDRDLREIRADLNREIGGLRGEVKSEVGGLRSEMNARFDKLNDSINSRFDAQNRTLIGVGATIVAALIGVNAF